MSRSNFGGFQIPDNLYLPYNPIKAYLKTFKYYSFLKNQIYD